MRHFWSQSSDGVDLDHAVLASLQKRQIASQHHQLTSTKNGVGGGSST
jgi:hypothetical protein